MSRATADDSCRDLFVAHLPIATARAGPTGVASAMQLDSTELLVEKRPPANLHRILGHCAVPRRGPNKKTSFER
eukprot:665665-Amphidinium_carterae.1